MKKHTVYFYSDEGIDALRFRANNSAMIDVKLLSDIDVNSITSSSIITVTITHTSDVYRQHAKWAVWDESDSLAFPMPLWLWDKSSKGEVLWVVSNNLECELVHCIDFDKMLRGLNVRDGSQILHLSGCTINHDNMPEQVTHLRDTTGIVVKEANPLLSFICVNNTQMDNLLDQTSTRILTHCTRDYRGVSYNRLLREHRYVLLSLLHEHSLAEQTCYSIGPAGSIAQYNAMVAGQFESAHTSYKNISTPHGSACVNRIVASGNKSTDDNTDLNFNQAHTVNSNDALNAYLHIVSETMPPGSYEDTFRNCTFITEKSYKPFFMMQPFVINGNHRTVDELRRMGFKTFDKWIDHSYDSIENASDRMIALVSEISRLYKLSDAEWNSMMYEMYGDLIHNHYLVRMFHATLLSDVRRDTAIYEFIDSHTMQDRN